MDIIELPQKGYEAVAHAKDPKTGLNAFIAVHNTKLGPGLGGIRMQPYSDETEALQDVLRLAHAMTYKSASVDLKLGGGKAVILGDPLKDKTPELFHAMGEFINTFQGKYLATKDAGIEVEDLVEVAKKTDFMTGLPEGSGDPSLLTARGIVVGMRACLKQKFQKNHFEGVRVAIQGMENHQN